MPSDATAPVTRCCLCDDPAVAVFHMPAGCVARPGLVKQPLCTHHAVRATPLCGMHLTEDLTAGREFGRWWRER